MNTSIQLSHVLSPGKDEYQYMSIVAQFPYLTEQQEQHYAFQHRVHGDVNAAQQLVLSHLRYVVVVAKMFRNYNQPFADLIQCGNVGLLKAVRKFDETRAVRLSTYSLAWIKAEIMNFIIDNTKLIKIATTKAQRKCFFHVRSTAKKGQYFNKQEAQQLADKLNIEVSEVVEMENRFNNLYDIPLNNDQDDSDEVKTYPQLLDGSLADNRYEPCALLITHDDHNTTSISSAIDQVLNAREKDIIESRWLNEEQSVTLHQLAAKYNVSAEWIRQIEQVALKKMKTVL